MKDQKTTKQKEQLSFFKTLFEGYKADSYIEIRTITTDEEIRRQYWYKLNQIKRIVGDLHKFKNTNIYFGVCARAQRIGKEEYIKEIGALWLDQDGNLDQVKRFELPPSIIISSGTKDHYHIYWLLDKVYPVKDRAETYIFKGYVKGLAQHLKADTKPFDLPRVLRVPYTQNRKNEANPVEVKLIELHPERRYKLEQFKKYYVVVEDMYVAPVDLSDQKIPEKFRQLLRRDIRLRINYEGKRKGLIDETKTGRDMALVNILIAYGFKGGEIAAVLKSTPYNKGKKLTADYLTLTIGKVRAGLTQRQKSMHDIKQKAMKIVLEGMNLDELREAKFEPEQFWIDKGLVPKIGFVILAGLKGTGKTSLTLQLCARLIKGNTTFLEQFRITSSPKILYIFAENVKPELLKIITTQEAALNLDLTKEQDQRLDIQPREHFDLLSCGGLAIFKEVFNIYDPDICVFDPIARFLSGKDINSMSVVNTVFDNLLYINDKCLWFFVAHMRKPQSKGKDIDEPMYKICGSSAFVNDCDTVITLDKASKQRSGLFNIVTFETRRAKPLEPIYTGMDADTRVCRPVTQIDILAGGAKAEDIARTLKQECKGKQAPTLLAKLCASKYKVSQKRVYELLREATALGLVAKEKGQSGNWYAL